MKKNNTEDERLCTASFIKMCMVELLLFVSVYAFLPNLWHRWEMIAAFVGGMFVVGMFHAYLGDAYKRKHILFYSTFLLAGTMVAYLLLPRLTDLQYVALGGVQGMLFGLATTAGTTVTIDITLTSHRTRGNIIFTLCSRLGMLAGLGVYLLVADELTQIYIAAASALLSALLALGVYVPFRSPIEVPVFSLDRFLLPRAWLPAINMLLPAFAVGVWMPAAVVLPLIIVPATRMFVHLSQHCQRGTANSTLQLAVDAGFWAGFIFGELFYLYQGVLFMSAAGLSVLMFVFITYPYYKKKRVR
ncbi:MAG: MFS transporter [Mediterranea sp.]|jgi:MFS family permease|nr:MFS transporter [Mediterranea sp.]